MSIEAVHSMLAWFQQKGGYVNPSAEVRSDPSSGIGLYASAPIEADETLISCPYDLAISSTLARRALRELYPGSDFEGWSARMLIAAYVALHWVYAEREEALPDALQHGPYVDSLPPPPTTPLYYTDKELGLLAGTNLLPGARDRKVEWEAESARVRQVIPSITWDRFLAVATYLSSRSFPNLLLKGEAAGGMRESEPVLAPGLDLLNHARGTPITWLSSPSPTSVPSVNFITNAAIPASSEIFNNYGPKPNEELLHGYAFTLPSNPDDTLGLKLGTGSSVPASVAAKLEREKLDMGQRFVVGIDGELPRDLLRVVRILLGGGGEHGHDHGDEDEDEHAAHEHEREELELEADVLAMLGDMLRSKLGAIGEVETEGCRADVVKDCVAYRDGQKAILRAAIEKIEERSERVEGLLEEGMECPCGC